jgi:hypothetical protein
VAVGLAAKAFKFGFIDRLDLRGQCGLDKLGHRGSWYPATTGNGADAVKAFLSPLATHLPWSVIHLDNSKLEIIVPQIICAAAQPTEQRIPNSRESLRAFHCLTQRC